MREMKRLEIVLKRDDLIYDVGNVAFISGDSAAADAKRRSLIQDAINDGNVDVIVRSFNKSFNELVHALTAFTEEYTRWNIKEGTVFLSPEEYVLRLKVPYNFSAPNSAAIATAAHDYMVNMALGKWFSIIKKEDADFYMMQGLQELEKIKGYLNARVHPVRRRMHPW